MLKKFPTFYCVSGNNGHGAYGDHYTDQKVKVATYHQINIFVQN